MNQPLIQLATLLLFCLPMLGCKKESETRAAARPVPTPVLDPSGGHGSIRGKIAFVGQPPAPRSIDNHICHANHPRAIVDESVVVNPNGTLKNVVVYLKEVPGDSATTPPPATLDQIDCQYVPHVVAIQAGQSVVFRSSDATLHNVHVLSEKGAAMNRALTGAGQQLPPVKFSEPEFTRVKCDVHPWMLAWIAVMDGPYFAVTAETGEFEIKDVPAGSYTLSAWHERFEPMTQAVIVTADKAADVTFTVGASTN